MVSGSFSVLAMVLGVAWGGDVRKKKKASQGSIDVYVGRDGVGESWESWSQYSLEVTQSLFPCRPKWETGVETVDTDLTLFNAARGPPLAGLQGQGWRVTAARTLKAGPLVASFSGQFCRTDEKCAQVLPSGETGTEMEMEIEIGTKSIPACQV